MDELKYTWAPPPGVIYQLLPVKSGTIREAIDGFDLPYAPVKILFDDITHTITRRTRTPRDGLFPVMYVRRTGEISTEVYGNQSHHIT